MNKTIISTIIDLLKVSDFYNESENIDIAKGKYKLPLSYTEMKNVIKRNKDYAN